MRQIYLSKLIIELFKIKTFLIMKTSYKFKQIILDYKAKIIALDTLCVQLKDHGNDKEIMKKKLQEMRLECERLMHNLKSSNRLLDETNKEKRHIEAERDDLVNIGIK